MAYYQRIRYLYEAVINSYKNPENRGIAGISGMAGIICSWNIASLDVGYFLVKYALPLKIIGGLCSIIIGPPVGTFMNDVYKEKIRPKIFKRKK